MNFLMPFGLRPTPRRDGPRYADMNVRCVAAGFDIFLIYLVLGGALERLHRWLLRDVDWQKWTQAGQKAEHSTRSALQLLWASQRPQAELVNYAIGFFILGLLIVGAQWAWGTTPGKWLMGIGIRRAGTLEPITRGRFLLRFAAYLVALFPLPIGMLWSSFDKQHRGWHDRIAGTVVIYVRPRGWLWRGIARLYKRLRGRSLVEQPVGEPAAEQGHQHGTEPVK